MHAQGYLRVGCLLGASAGMFFLIYTGVPAFKSLFAGFGLDLPAVTSFVIGTYKYYLLLPVVAVTPQLAQRHNRALPHFCEPVLRGVAERAFFVSLAVTILCIIAMYTPIIWSGFAS